MSDALIRLQQLWRIKSQTLQLSQTELAKRLNISQPALSQYLTGRIPLNTDFIIHLARVLGVSPLDIDPKLQHIYLPQLQRIQVKIVNTGETLETFGEDPTCLGFTIPDNRYAPRFQQGDNLIFIPISQPVLNVNLLAYNEHDYKIDKHPNLPTQGYNLGVIKAVIPR